MHHWKFAIAAGVVCAVFAGSASAGDMSGYFGNTVLCKYPNGDVTKVYVNQDHTFLVVPTGHPQTTGTWADSGTTVCYTQTNPAPDPKMHQVCNSSQARKVGDSWDVTDPYGAHCTATMAAGKQ